MILALGAVDWTQVLILGVPAYIAALGGAIAAVVAALNRRNLKTPSGDRIGTVVERAHDLSAIAVAATTGATGHAVDRAKERLNGELDPPVSSKPTGG